MVERSMVEPSILDAPTNLVKARSQTSVFLHVP